MSLTATPVVLPNRDRSIQSNVSDQAHQRWHHFAARNGVSVGALIEVLTSVSDSDQSSTDPSDLSLVIAQARNIDARRRGGVLDRS